MAISTCPHCQNNSFELREGEISGAQHRLLLVQCAKCGAPFGANYDYAALLQEQDARIKNIEHQVSAISSHLAHIGRIVSSLANQHSI